MVCPPDTGIACPPDPGDVRVHLIPGQAAHEDQGHLEIPMSGMTLFFNAAEFHRRIDPAEPPIRVPEAPGVPAALP